MFTLTLDTETPVLLLFHHPSISLCPSGCRFSTVHGGPPPATMATSSPGVLVRLWLALGPLRLRVGGAGRVRVLDRHGSPQVGAFTQEVRFGREAEGAFPQDHADRGGLLGSGPVAKLQ